MSMGNMLFQFDNSESENVMLWSLCFFVFSNIFLTFYDFIDSTA